MTVRRDRLFTVPFVARLRDLVSRPDERVSTSHGTHRDGWLENGVSLPLRGRNFVAYSYLMNLAGRAYVHSTVRAIVLDAYRTMESVRPGYRFRYVEASLACGGRMRPHRTHRNGTSVDFAVPVRLGNGQPALMPAHPFNNFGYDIEIDANFCYRQYRVDFETLAEHLIALHQAAVAHGAGIDEVILDFVMQDEVRKTSQGEYIRQHIPFNTKASWVRHDDHYHVNFAVPGPC